MIAKVTVFKFNKKTNVKLFRGQYSINKNESSDNNKYTQDELKRIIKLYSSYNEEYPNANGAYIVYRFGADDVADKLQVDK